MNWVKRVCVAGLGRQKSLSVAASVRDRNETGCSRKQNQFIKGFIIRNYQVPNLSSCYLRSRLKADREERILQSQEGPVLKCHGRVAGDLSVGERSIFYFIQTLQLLNKAYPPYNGKPVFLSLPIPCSSPPRALSQKHPENNFVQHLSTVWPDYYSAYRDVHWLPYGPSVLTYLAAWAKY